MEFGGLKIDLMGFAQVIMAVGTLVTALVGARISIRQMEKKPRQRRIANDEPDK